MKVRISKLICAMILAVLCVGGLSMWWGAKACAEETDDTLPASGTCGTDLTWVLDTEGVLTISGTGDMADFDMNPPWADHRSEVKTAVIEAGVTSIGQEAFYSCRYLTKVSIPDTVSQIGDRAFTLCSRLEEVTLPAEVDSLGTGIFQYDRALTEVTIPEAYTFIGESMFEGCSGLTKITLPAGLKRIQISAFKGCTALEYIELPESMSMIQDSAFRDCTSLTTFTMPRTIGWMGRYIFEGCTSLVSVSMPEGIGEIKAGMFSGCINLASLDIPESVTTIGEAAFWNCVNLSDLVLPEGCYYIEYGAFWGCRSIQQIQIPDSVKSIEQYAFAYCSGAEKLTISGNLENGCYLYPYAFAWCENLTEAVITEGVYEIENDVFFCCVRLAKVTLPSYAPVMGDSVFAGCSDELLIYFGDDEEGIAPDEVSKAVGETTTNAGYQNYYMNASPINSYLNINEDGTRTRVEYTGYHLETSPEGAADVLSGEITRILVEEYDADGRYIDVRCIPRELPIFGGYYADEDYNFFVFGQEAPSGNNEEVIRVVRYTKDWERVDSASLYGVNTTVPFTGGTLRMTEKDGMLYIYTCHNMFLYTDGFIHQANMLLSLDIASMNLTDIISEYSDEGIISHSFNQFIITDGDQIVTVDQGDGGSTRGVMLSRCDADADRSIYGCVESIKVFDIMGATYAPPGTLEMLELNATGVSLGGFEQSSTNYIIAGNSVVQDAETYDRYGKRNIFVTVTSKSDFSKDGTTVRWITSYSGEEEVSTPQLVKISDEKFLLMWTVDGVLNYVFLDGNGELTSEVYTSEDVVISSCQPCVEGDRVIWYSTQDNRPVFYELDTNVPEDIQIQYKPDDQTHQVRFCLTGGTLQDGEEDTKSVVYGETYGELPEPVREGYAFLGWYRSPFKIQYEDQLVTSETLVQTKKKETLYAGWLITGNCGDNLTWTESGGVLTITGTGEMYSWFNEYLVPWANIREKIMEVVIGEGCTYISDYAFQDCPNLKKITVPLTVTVIAGSAFANCSADLVMYGYDGSCAQEFAEEHGITFVAISYEGKGELGENLSWHLKDGILTVSGQGAMPDYQEGEDLPWTICKRFIKKVVVESGVTGIGDYGFSDCTNLTEIELAESVKTVGNYAFANCKKLQTVTGMSGVTDVETYAFNGCSSLCTMNLAQTLESIGSHGFNGCAALSEVVLADSLKEVGSYAFSGCSGLSEIELPDGVTIGEYAFKNCTGLLKAVLPADMETVPTGMLYNCSSLKAVSLPDSVTRLEDCAFYGTGITEMWILPQVEYIADTSFGGGLFIYGYTNTAAESFASKKELIFYALDGTFGDALTWYIDIVDGSMKIEGEGSMSLDGTSASVPWENVKDYISTVSITEGITDIGGNAFSYCSNLTRAVVPYTASVIADTSFAGCREDLVIAGYEGSTAETYAAKKGITFEALQYSFCGACGSQLTWQLEDGVLTISGTGKMTNWSKSQETPWYPYKKLIESIALGENVTSIGAYAFADCDDITSITIPANITELGKGAFQNCDNLAEVIFSGDAPSLGYDIFEGITATVTYPVDNTSWDNADVLHVGGTITWKNHIHKIVIDAAVDATCEESGLTEGSHCCWCGLILTEQEVQKPLGHKEVTDTAVDATCEKSGLTEGSHCSRCGKVFTAQKTVSALGHDEVEQKAVAATCTQSGLTAGKYCRRCNTVLVEQTVVDELGHNTVTDAAVDVTCEVDGLTEGSHCSRCGEIFVKQEVIKAPGHDIVTDQAVAATCTQTGLTAGSHCRRCKQVLVKQEVTKALGHNVVTDVGVTATCISDGLTEGSHCSRCQEVLVPQVVIPAGHTIVRLPAVEATCTQAGRTEGKYCSICGEILQEQEVIPAKGHQYSSRITEEATCYKTGVSMHVCSDCQDTYYEVIPKQPHRMTYYPEVPATCVNPGTKAYYYCEGCQQKFTDEAGTESINVLNIPSLGHSFVDGVCTRCSLDINSGTIQNPGDNGSSENPSGSGGSAGGTSGTNQNNGGDAQQSSDSSEEEGDTDENELDIRTGQIIVDEKGASYQVTKAEGADLTVAYKKIPEDAKGTITIPNTLTISTKTYKVTSVAANVCRNNKKITKLVIGKNVRTIGKNAFKGCTKLKSVVIKTTKLTKKTVGDNAFKGIPDEAEIKVPKSKKAEYKTLLRLKGVGKKVKIK